MVRKFSFKITPLKVTSSTSSPAVEAPPVIEFMETPSPPFEPASPLYTPPDALPPSVELELRCACAIILRALKPSGQIYEDMAKQDYSEAQTLRRLQQQQQKIESKTPRTTMKAAGPESYRPKPPQLNRTVSNISQLYRHVPQNAGAAFASTTEIRHSVLGHKRRKSADNAPSAGFAQQLEGRLSRLAAQDRSQARWAGPPGADCPCLPSDFTNAESASSHTPVSAAPLSDIHPAFRPSLEGLRPMTTAISDSHSLQRTDTNAGDEISRPPSRRNRIAEYIRPSSSQGSIRSVRTTRSTESTSNGNAWWRPLLSSRKSSGSLRRGSGETAREREEEEANRVNLNRALPPLPSLSNWDSSRKEEAATTTTTTTIKPATAESNNSREERPHIAQLLKRKSAAALSSGRPQTAPQHSELKRQQSAESRPTTLAPTIDPPRLPALQFGTLDSSGSTSPNSQTQPGQSSLPVPTSQQRPASSQAHSQQQPLASRDPNTSSAPISRVQTKKVEKWRGRMGTNGAKDTPATSVPEKGAPQKQRTVLEEKAAAHQLSASSTTGRFGRLKRQLSRFALGGGNASAMESGRVGF